MDPGLLPQPDDRTFTGPGGRDVHAHVYPPRNPDFTAPDDELPPYVIWVHGGPTSRTPLVLDLEIAYFTSRGIGVAEVNYGGSTGYGREYRNRLREQWGVVDVEDCAPSPRPWPPRAPPIPRRLAIRGGSAGGWTTAAALTSAPTFACGTIIYPILDLVGWSAGGETHDFESQYLESLIGPLAEVPDRYRERSPVQPRRPGHRAVPAAPGARRRDLPARAGRTLPGDRSPDAASRTPTSPSRARATASAGWRPWSTCLEAELSLYGQVFGFTPPSVPLLELTS